MWSQWELSSSSCLWHLTPVKNLPMDYMYLYLPEAEKLFLPTHDLEKEIALQIWYSWRTTIPQPFWWAGFINFPKHITDALLRSYRWHSEKSQMGQKMPNGAIATGGVGKSWGKDEWRLAFCSYSGSAGTDTSRLMPFGVRFFFGEVLLLSFKSLTQTMLGLALYQCGLMKLLGNSGAPLVV